MPATPRDVFLLHDVSPSATSAEPGVRERALVTLLESLSPASQVTRVAYAREAQVLDETALAPADVPVDEALPWLGIRTRFETAWGAIRERVTHAHDPLIVIVGDGAIGSSREANVALDELADAGAQLSLVSIADRRQRANLVATVTRTLGRRVEAYRDDATPALRLLVAPVVDPDVRIGRESLGPLRAGETRVIERVEHGGAVGVLNAFGRRIRPSQPRGSWATGLATRLAPEDLRAVLVAASQDQIQAARKDRRAVWGAGLSPRFARRRGGIVCGLPICHCSVMGGISRESGQRLRAQLRPAVRGCFARARRGRPSWSARVTLRMAIRYGELERVGSTSTTEPALAQCIVDAAERLQEVPFSETMFAMNFPFRSDAVAAPLPEPLAPEVDRALESIGVRALRVRASRAP